MRAGIVAPGQSCPAQARGAPAQAKSSVPLDQPPGQAMGRVTIGEFWCYYGHLVEKRCDRVVLCGAEGRDGSIIARKLPGPTGAAVWSGNGNGGTSLLHDLAAKNAPTSTRSHQASMSGSAHAANASF